MFRRAQELDRLNLPFAVVTIIGSDGIVPRRSGRMLVTEQGETESTIGGHLIENTAVKASLEAIEEGEGRIIDVSTGRGSVKLMVDVVNKAKRAYIIGYGYVGRTVAKTLYSVGYALYIYDINPVDCPFAAETHTGRSWSEILSTLVLDAHSALIVTIHSKDDVLSMIDCSKAFYVGAMASRSRIIPDKRIFAPIGLDIGAETPEEVAVSITAEVMKAYSAGSGLPGRDRRARFIMIAGCCSLSAATAERLVRAGYDVLIAGSVSSERTERIERADDAFHVLDEGRIPVFAGSAADVLDKLHPTVFIGVEENGKKIRDKAPFTISVSSYPDEADADTAISSGGSEGAVTGAVLEAVDAFFSRY